MPKTLLRIWWQDEFFLNKAGACWDPPHHVGLSHLVASVITRGTGHYSALEIAETIESLGAQLHTGAANDYWSLSLKAITSDFYQLLTLAADILCSPTFPDSEIELEKRLILQALQSQQEQPFNLAFQKLRQALYGDHPYGHSILGKPNLVTQFNRQDLW